MVDKEHILAEIRRTAEGRAEPLGAQRFFAETGIRQADWLGRYWARWGDALQEAGFAPNRMNAAYPDDFLFEKLAGITRSLGHFPARTEIQLAGQSDPELPSRNVFMRIGRKSEVAKKLAAWCGQRNGFEDVMEICSRVSTPKGTSENAKDVFDFGWVYLLKSGRFFKIGRTNAIGRRERELAIQLPEKAVVVHSIKTDDPEGIEAYWHNRFSSCRKNGEWFELSASDISAFKRRKFM